MFSDSVLKYDKCAYCISFGFRATSKTINLTRTHTHTHTDNCTHAAPAHDQLQLPKKKTKLIKINPKRRYHVAEIDARTDSTGFVDGYIND